MNYDFPAIFSIDVLHNFVILEPSHAGGLEQDGVE